MDIAVQKRNYKAELDGFVALDFLGFAKLKNYKTILKG